MAPDNASSVDIIHLRTCERLAYLAVVIDLE